ncbi:TetR/AcrR family transcriptional regulator [Paenibacillus sp.]|jgi:AcrR family transcriptional regulator|uniref:TetR/AcrR family transcriptional regulator n=1 Tax=Paenibacillus sp. TaxID=58172 RepID=UPI0028176BA6|nr:TetR/AcrR family transcriptional regulator [Paenibacillus sp.]MDR0270779.1 TetR/AcrR family transcriptional regulator [Paenibacillus sp.]
MPRKKQVRSEDTKRDILAAAGKLFAVRGYDAVSMREIAKEAGCSHTTIYIYFEDKEALLNELSMPSLLKLKENFGEVFQHERENPQNALKQISQLFIRFCLLNRNMYRIFFEVKAERVDEDSPEMEINQIRNQLFGLLMQVVRDCTGLMEGSERLLAYTRIYFYMLHGMVGTYQYSEETAEELMQRLADTFDEGFEVLLLGFREKTKSDH